MTKRQKLSANLKTFSEQSHDQFNNQSTRGTINRLDYLDLLKQTDEVTFIDYDNKEECISVFNAIQDNEDRKYIQEHLKSDEVNYQLFEKISTYILWLQSVIS